MTILYVFSVFGINVNSPRVRPGRQWCVKDTVRGLVGWGSGWGSGGRRSGAQGGLLSKDWRMLGVCSPVTAAPGTATRGGILCLACTRRASGLAHLLDAPGCLGDSQRRGHSCGTPHSASMRECLRALHPSTFSHAAPWCGSAHGSRAGPCPLWADGPALQLRTSARPSLLGPRSARPASPVPALPPQPANSPLPFGGPCFSPPPNYAQRWHKSIKTPSGSHITKDRICLENSFVLS